MNNKSEKQALEFESDVRQVLDLVINSLYSNKEIFLRELISNAADAIDKLRFAALSDESLYEGEKTEPEIFIDFSEKAKTITIRDYGIGMTRDEVVENLGTIARSGTKQFFKNLEKGDQESSELIGQFGVGFYSAFIVAEKVIVSTRKAGLQAEEGTRWESEGKGEFTLENIVKKKRGTEIILYLKKESKSFADNATLKNICKKYSNHISAAVMMPKDDGATGFEKVNEGFSLWRRSKNEISGTDYDDFYKSISFDFEKPLKYIHTKSEGKVEYTSLFYIPSKPPFDLWDRDNKSGVRLYVKRVLIMEDSEQLIPRYLRFVKGVIDTDDLPLNVSRELLQKNKKIESIKGGCVKKILSMVENMAKKPDVYRDFWNNFGSVLKEGIIEDSVNKEKLSKLLRYESNQTENGEQTSLKEYVSRMKESQDVIYFLTSDSIYAARKSPHLEYFKDKEIEVLLMVDAVDEWVVNHLEEFDGNKLQSITQIDALSSDDKDTSASESKDGRYKDLLNQMKKILEDKVSDVVPSSRLTESLSCLVNPADQMSANLERVLRASGQTVPSSKKILEVNLSHPLIEDIDKSDDDLRQRWALLLFYQASLAGGIEVEDPGEFVKIVNQLLKK
tara:strand:+ start:483 stop:2339 length:1857 start_codon:yes stop_codon:yes gene_type:complete